MKTKILIPSFLLATTVIFANNLNYEIKDIVFIENIKVQNNIEANIISILEDRGLDKLSALAKLNSFKVKSHLDKNNLNLIVGIENISELDICKYLSYKVLRNSTFNSSKYSDLIALVQSKSIYISKDNLDKISQISQL